MQSALGVLTFYFKNNTYAVDPFCRIKIGDDRKCTIASKNFKDMDILNNPIDRVVYSIYFNSIKYVLTIPLSMIKFSCTNTFLKLTFDMENYKDYSQNTETLYNHLFVRSGNKSSCLNEA